jgi:HAD superfamily hydrolase (TIGR01509 family)
VPAAPRRPPERPPGDSPRACLIDVYDTILISRFPGRARVLAALAGVDVAAWTAEWLKGGLDRNVGRLTMAGSFARTLEGLGRPADPALLDRLVAADARLIVAGTEVYDDTIPFLAKLRANGIRTAFVSNCAPNTRPMLAAKGLLDLADAAILSCEAGAAKPDRMIYRRALDALNVPARDACMLDDQPRFCESAEALGIRAIQVVRPGVEDRFPDGRFPVVSALLDVLPLL